MFILCCVGQSFQRISPDPGPCVTFCNMLAFYYEGLLPQSPALCWKTTSYQLSVTVYSMYMWLTFISGGSLLHYSIHNLDMPCNIDAHCSHTCIAVPWSR
jgi:hypothetical protein